MKSESWPKVKEIFEAALARPAAERAAFLDQACAGDQSLRQEVESLLKSYGEAESFMETPAIRFISKLKQARRGLLRPSASSLRGASFFLR